MTDEQIQNDVNAIPANDTLKSAVETTVKEQLPVDNTLNANIKKVFNYFLIGTLAVIPIVIILKIILFVKTLVSDAYFMVYRYSDNFFYTMLFFILSFIILVSIGHKLVKKGRPWVITIAEHIINRIPFLNTLYRVLKKVINMFSSQEETIAKEIVYVEYPKEGIWVPAYVTNRLEGKCVLFIPTSPNPTSGFTVIVDESKIIPSAMDIEEATSFIVSVGVDYNQSVDMRNLP